MKNILITGNAGFIGSNLVRALESPLNEQYNIVGIDNLSGGYIENISDHISFYKRDLALHDISDIFRRHKFDYVIHAAADAREVLSPFIRKQSYQNNIIASMNIINNCIEYDIQKIIYFSSIGVYGHGTFGQKFTENDTPNPRDCYSIGKFSTELDLRAAGEQHGLEYTILRPFNIYGPQQCIYDTYRNVLGIWMRQTLEGKPLTIYGSGDQVRCFTYIGDIIQPILQCLTNTKTNRETINLGGLQPYTINEAADIFIKTVGVGTKEYLEPRYESNYSVSLCEKAHNLLGFVHNTSLEQGILQMYEWVLNSPRRNLLDQPSYEITKGMYSYWK